MRPFISPRSSRGNEALIIFPESGSKHDQSLVTSAATLLVLPILLSGCIVLPLPNRDTGNPRVDLGQKIASRIEPALTTREQVMLELGEPDAISHDERVLAYRTSRPVAFWVVAAGYGAAGGTIDQVRSLVISFDEHGIVQSRQANSQVPGVLVNSQFKDTPDAVLGSAISSISNEVVRISAVAEWIPDFEQTSWKVAFGTRGRLLLTDSTLYWLTAEQPANTAPGLALNYNSISDCKLGKSVGLTWIILRTTASRVHTLKLWKTYWPDNAMTKQAAEFIQSKIDPLPSVPHER